MGAPRRHRHGLCLATLPQARSPAAAPEGSREPWARLRSEQLPWRRPRRPNRQRAPAAEQVLPGGITRACALRPSPSGGAARRSGISRARALRPSWRRPAPGWRLVAQPVAYNATPGMRHAATAPTRPMPCDPAAAPTFEEEQHAAAASPRHAPRDPACGAQPLAAPGGPTDSAQRLGRALKA